MHGASDGLATTFCDVPLTRVVVTSRVAAAPLRCAASRLARVSLATLTAGICVGSPDRSPRKRPGWLLTTISPAAPAACALCTFSANVSSPRSTTAIFPRTSTAANSEVRPMPANTTGSLTLPFAEPPSGAACGTLASGSVSVADPPSVACTGNSSSVAL